MDETHRKSLFCVVLVAVNIPVLIAVTPVTCSESSCSDLGWTSNGVGGTHGSNGICGESDDSPLSSCSGLLSFEEAVNTCEEVGARLCSLDEIVNDETKGTGCNYDDQYIWTYNTCPSSTNDNMIYYTSIGSSTDAADIVSAGGNSTECMSSTTDQAYVRCCADEYSCSPTLVPTMPTPVPSIPSASPVVVTATPTYFPSENPSPVPTVMPTPSPTAMLSLENFGILFVDKDRLEVSWSSPTEVASKIVRFELRLAHDDGSSWTTEFFETTETSAETYIFTGLTCNTKYRVMLRAVIAADDLIGPNGAVLTALHNEVYGPWYSTSWQRLLACYVASSPGGYDGLTLTKGNFAHRHSLRLDWITPTDDTNLDYFEIRYRASASTSTWSYTTARPKATSKILYNDQHGTLCGTLYQVQIRSSGGQGDWAKGAWVEQSGRTKNCPLPTMMPVATPAR